MTSKSNKLRAQKALLRKPKKRSNVVVKEKIGFVDYKDVNLLQRFMSDRSKLRARRMNGNNVQLQRDIATAVKNAREMALLPYMKQVSAARAPRERGPRRPRRDDAAPRSSVTVSETVEVAPNITAEISTEVSVDGAAS